MRQKKFFRVIFVVLCTVICCLLGHWTRSISIEESTEAEISPEPTLSLDFSDNHKARVQMDGCRYAYNMGDEYFSYELYDSSNNYALYEFEQKYDTEGKPVYTDIVIPDKIDDVPVVAVSYQVFKNHPEIRSVTLGKYVVEVGKEAFYGCKNMENIILSSDLILIEDAAFKNCISLKEISIPKDVENINDEAFNGCTSLENVEYNGTKLNIWKGVFENTEWVRRCKEDGVPAVLNRILVDASGLSGEVMITEEDVERIMPEAFKYADDVTYLEIDGVKELSSFMVSGNKSIQKIKVSNVECMGVSCFSDAIGLEEVILCQGISEIPKACFARCNKLESIKIYSENRIKWGTEPDNAQIHLIFMGVFPGTENLKDIYLYSDEIDTSLRLVGVPKTVTLHLSAEQVEKYEKYMPCKVVAL